MSRTTGARWSSRSTESPGMLRILHSPCPACHATPASRQPPANLDTRCVAAHCLHHPEKEAPMAITLSHGGPTIYRSAEPSRQVLVGTIKGVVCLERDSGGGGWDGVHRTLTDKHVHALMIEPESGTIFAGMKHGSMFASGDGGRTWDRRDKGLTEQNVDSLACARLADGVRVFAGTAPAHLFYSDDLGRGWTELPALRSVDTSRWSFPAPPGIAHTKHINFHPRDAQTLFIGVEQGGLLKSTDAGKTFQVIPG